MATAGLSLLNSVLVMQNITDDEITCKLIYEHPCRCPVTYLMHIQYRNMVQL